LGCAFYSVPNTSERSLKPVRLNRARIHHAAALKPHKDEKRRCAPHASPPSSLSIVRPNERRCPKHTPDASGVQLMFDTVKLTCVLHQGDVPVFEALRPYNFQIQYGRDQEGRRWARAQRKPRDERATEPSITLFDRECGLSTLAVEVSLPAYLSGSNVRDLSCEELPEALDAVSSFVHRVTNIDAFDATDADIRRLDACHNWRVGEENIKAYIDAACLAQPPRFESPLTQGATYVLFRSDSRQLVLYGKYEQMLSKKKKGFSSNAEEAHGIIRLEHRLRGTKAVSYFAKERMGLPDRKARNLLTPAVWSFMMEEALNALHLNTQTPPRDERMNALVKAFGIKATDYYGLLAYRDLWGEDFWQKIGMDYNTFWRKRKKLQEAGLWTATPTPGALPSLHIVEPIRKPALEKIA
jgi:hypothetical protein